MRPGQSTGCSRSQEVGNATTASAIETFSGRHLSGFVCHRRMQPYSSPPDRLKNTLPHVGPTTSLRTVILRGDRGLAHTVAMIEVTCDVSFGSWLRKNALPQFATVRDPVNVVRHGRFEHFFRVGRSGPSLSHRGECWARPRDRHATGVSMLTP